MSVLLHDIQSIRIFFFQQLPQTYARWERSFYWKDPKCNMVNVTIIHLFNLVVTSSGRCHFSVAEGVCCHCSSRLSKLFSYACIHHTPHHSPELWQLQQEDRKQVQGPSNYHSLLPCFAICCLIGEVISERTVFEAAGHSLVQCTHRWVVMEK